MDEYDEMRAAQHCELEVEINVPGYCKFCQFRDTNGFCNNDKLAERENFTEEESRDMLLYSYVEDGCFWVGPEFGCIHYTCC
jgi:hypothetical protein